MCGLALPILALVPGCHGGSGGIPIPTSTPTSTATGIPTGTSQTATPVGTAATAIPTFTPRPTTTATTTPTNTARPTATPTTGPNVDLTLTRVSGTPNTPLTPLKSDYLGIYYSSSRNVSFLKTRPSTNPYKGFEVATQGDVHNYRVGQVLTLASEGVLYLYETNNDTYRWGNKKGSNGRVQVVAKSADAITLQFTNVVMAPLFADEPSRGEFSFNGRVRCAITDPPN